MGAILLSERLEKVLLVRGWSKNSAWGFPRGKRTKDETDEVCAIREVWSGKEWESVRCVVRYVKRLVLTSAAVWTNDSLLKSMQGFKEWSCSLLKTFQKTQNSVLLQKRSNLKLKCILILCLGDWCSSLAFGVWITYCERWLLSIISQWKWPNASILHGPCFRRSASEMDH